MSYEGLQSYFGSSPGIGVFNKTGFLGSFYTLGCHRGIRVVASASYFLLLFPPTLVLLVTTKLQVTTKLPQALLIINICELFDWSKESKRCRQLI